MAGEGCCQNRAKSTEEGEEEGGEGIFGEGGREMQRALFRFPGRRTFSSAGLAFFANKKIQHFILCHAQIVYV